MNKDTYRITARILREDGIEKTITFRGNFGNMDHILAESFHAVKYKLYKINETRISSTAWEPVKTDEEIKAELQTLIEKYKLNGKEENENA